MAGKTYFLIDTSLSSNGTLSETSATAADTGTGWVCGTATANSFSTMLYATIRARNTFATGTNPLTTPAAPTTGQAWRTIQKIHGTFSSATAWQLDFKFQTTTTPRSQQGRIMARIWKSANELATSASELTIGTAAGFLTFSTTSAITTANSTSSFTWSPGTLTFDNEYLFIQPEWCTVIVGTNTGANVVFESTDSTIVAPNYTPTTTTATGTESFAAADSQNAKRKLTPLFVSESVSLADSQTNDTVFPSLISSYPTASGAPAGWSALTGDLTGSQIVADNTADPYTDRIFNTSGKATAADVGWDIAGSFEDSEVLALAKLTGTLSAPTIYYNFIFVHHTTDGQQTHHCLSFLTTTSSGGTQVAIRDLSAGAAGNFDLQNFTWATDTWYWIRLRQNGSNLNARIWAKDDAEPGTWLLNSAVAIQGSLPRRVGFRQFAGDISNIAYFSAAVNGQTAPSPAKLYEATATESFAAADSQNASKLYKATGAESLSAADNQSATRKLTPLFVSESFVAADSQNFVDTTPSTGDTYVPFINPPITLGISALTQFSRKKVAGAIIATAAETISLADTQTRTKTTKSTAAETIALADSQSARTRTLVTGAESLGLTDAQSAIKSTRATASESIGLADTQAAARTTRATAAETISLTDSQSVKITTRAIAAETVSLADSQIARKTTTSAVSETLLFADTQTRALLQRATAAETITLADAQTGRRTTKATATETIALADSQSTKLTTRVTAAETIILTDTATATTVSVGRSTVQETIDLADTQTGRRTTKSTAAESILLADSQAVLRTTKATAAESILLADSQTRLRTTRATASESIGLTDTQTRLRKANVSVAETISLADSQATKQRSTGTQAETILLSDSQTARQTSSATVSETITLTDTTDGTVLAAGVAQCPESFGPLDQCDATVISGAIVDTHDGVRKKKKKKKQLDFTEEVSRRERIRKQIEEVIHPPEVLPTLPEEKPQEKEPEKAREIKPIAPAVDYSARARDEIVARIKQEAQIKPIPALRGIAQTNQHLPRLPKHVETLPEDAWRNRIARFQNRGW